MHVCWPLLSLVIAWCVALPCCCMMLGRILLVDFMKSHAWLLLNPRVFVKPRTLNIDWPCTVPLAGSQSQHFVVCTKTQRFGLVARYLQICHADHCWLTKTMLFDHACSNYSSNLQNSFLSQISSKNHENFSIIFTWMSSIWLWFLINFSLAGF